MIARGPEALQFPIATSAGQVGLLNFLPLLLEHLRRIVQNRYGLRRLRGWRKVHVLQYGEHFEQAPAHARESRGLRVTAPAASAVAGEGVELLREGIELGGIGGRK